MTATSVLAGLNEEATQLEVLGNISLLLTAMLANMPRVDTAKRVVIGNEATQTVTVSSGTVTTVTTTADVTRVNAFGASATSKPADAIPMHMANAGTMHIYNNIIVS